MRRAARGGRSTAVPPAVLLACAVALAAAGCGRSIPPIRAVTPRTVIVAFGDSLTAGVNGRNQAYPAYLEELLGCRVVNAGKPGELSRDGLSRLPDVLEEHQPGLVILCHGGNDMLQRDPPDRIAEQIEQMIRMIKATGADVILVGVPRPSLTLATAAFYSELADRHHLPYDGSTLSRILKQRSLRADQIHPNADGNRHLATALATLIRRAAAR